MIRVKIFPPMGITVKNVDERCWMELEEGSTLQDLLKKGGIPRLTAKLFMVRLNSEQQPLNTVLKDGDVVGFFALVAGG